MKKIVFLILFIPFVANAVETNSRWKIGLVELSGVGKNNTYGQVLINSLKTSLEKSGFYKCRVYNKRIKLFETLGQKDKGKRKSLIQLVPKSGEDFLISGDYQVSNGKIYVILYAIDGAAQKIRMIKSYTGKTDIDIFDLIDEIASDFSTELQKNLPAPKASVIIRYRKKLEWVSEKQKFPRLLTSSFYMEYQSADSDQTAIQAIFLMQMQVERWLFSIRGPLTPLNIIISSTQNQEIGTPTTLNVGFYLSVGKLLNKHWAVSLAPGMHLVGNSGGPFFMIYPIVEYRPTGHFKLQFIPGTLNISALLGSNYWVYAPFPLMLQTEWELSDKLALFASVSADYSASSSNTLFGWTAGLGLSYKIGIDF